MKRSLTLLRLSAPLAAISCLLSPALGVSQEAAREVQAIDWDLTDPAALPAGAAIVRQNRDGRQISAVKIKAGPSTEPIAVLDMNSPGISADEFALQGSLRYEEVKSPGYLELLVYFPDGRSFFSRALNSAGPGRRILGASDWRAFSLPFNTMGSALKPARLKLNLILPQGGTVYLSGLKLTEAGGGPGKSGRTWYSERNAVKIGGWGGAILGGFAGILGMLAGLGACRRFVTAALKAMLALGLLCLAAGAAALIHGQPYAIWYPLLLIGVILAAVIGFNYKGIQRRYDDVEQKRMKAKDLGAR